MRPLLVTPGEPAGVGPDILLALANTGVEVPLIAVCSLELLKARAEQLNLKVVFRPVTEHSLPISPLPAGELAVLDCELAAPVHAGKLNPENGRYVLNTLDTAIRLTQSGRAAGIVTGPVQKSAIIDSGQAFSGHTEYLRDAAGIDEVVMMLATEGLRVALVTTHLPLKDVSAAITKHKLKRVTRILFNALKQQFGITEPRILVTGLNPHAGESGHLGTEEIDTIIPALQELDAEGIATSGPYPADTLFQPHYLEGADAVLAMYHDQGLPVLKFKGFHNAINITLGLPYIRTSVDHGTALDLAGTGKANSDSLLLAIQTAQQMAAAQGI